MSFIAPSDKTTGTVVTAAHWNQDVVENVNALFPDEAAGASWTPTITATSSNPTFTFQSGIQYRIGAIQFCWGRVAFDGSGVGVYLLELPRIAVGLSGSDAAHNGQIIGGWTGRNVNAPDSSRGGAVQLGASDDEARFMLDGDTPAGGVRAVQSDSPFVWNDDVLSFWLQYPIA